MVLATMSGVVGFDEVGSEFLKVGPGVGGFRAVCPYSFCLSYDDVEFSSLCTMGVVVHVFPTVCFL